MPLVPTTANLQSLSDASSQKTEPQAKVARLPKSSIVGQVKWYKTGDGVNVYSYFPKTVPNRAKKDLLMETLGKKQVPVTVLSKEIAFKGSTVASYVFVTSASAFEMGFPSVVSATTRVVFNNIQNNTAKA